MRDQKIPLSRTLFLVAVAHFLVWSIGVCEEPAKDFFNRETSSVSEGAAPRPTFTFDALAVLDKASENQNFNETQKEIELNLDKVQIVSRPSHSPINFFIPVNNYSESDSDASNYE